MAIFKSGLTVSVMVIFVFLANLFLEEFKLGWVPLSTIAIDEEQAQTLFKLIEVLEDNDDVQEVIANFEVSDEVMAKLNG